MNSENSTVVSGRRLIFSRSVWAVGIATYLLLFLTGLPATYARALILSPETQAGLAARGLAPNAPALYWLTLDTLTILAFAFVAVYIVRQRPDDWLVMLTSLMLVGTAALYTAPPAESPLPVWLVAAAFGFAEICQVAFVYLFPNGKFVPRWVWIFLVPMFIWRPAVWGLVYLPGFYATVRTGENYGTLRQGALDTALVILLLVIGIGAQVYRYRRVATPMQKQQTKWLVFGIIAAFSVAASYVVVVNALGLPDTAGPEALAARMIGRTARQVGLFMLPVALAFSILRYRLWQIDLLLRRTLIYVPLTGIITGIFAALIALAERLFIDLAGENSFGLTVIITLIAVAFVDPVRAWLRTFVDEHFKTAPDPHIRLNQFASEVDARLSKADPAQLLARLGDEAAMAFQAHSAAWVDCGGTLLPVGGLAGVQDGLSVRLEVRALNQRLGAIALGPRPFERPYSPSDTALLESVALTVGNAIVQDRALP